MSVQTSHDEENLKMRKSLPSDVSAMASSAIPENPRKQRLCFSQIISKEDLELWMKNHPVSQLRAAAESFGVSHSTMVRLCRKYGLSGHRNKYPRYPKEALERYLSSHPDATYRAMAKHFGGTSGAAKLAVNRYDLDHLKSPRGKWKRNQYSKEALERYLSSHPDATYRAMAEHFGGTSETVRLAIIRHDLDHLKSPRGKWKKKRSQ